MKLIIVPTIGILLTLSVLFIGEKVGSFNFSPDKSSTYCMTNYCDECQVEVFVGTPGTLSFYRVQAGNLGSIPIPVRFNNSTTYLFEITGVHYQKVPFDYLDFKVVDVKEFKTITENKLSFGALKEINVDGNILQLQVRNIKTGNETE